MESQDNFAYLLPFIMAAFGGIFLAAQRFNASAARYWGLGYLSAAAGFVAPLALQGLPVEWGAVTSNILFFAAFFLYGHALLVRFNRPLLLVPRILVTVVALATVSYLIVVKQDLRTQLSVGDGSLVLLLGMPVCVVWRHARNFIDRLLVVMAGLVVLETAVRVVALLTMTSASSYASLDDFLSSDYAFFMQVTASIIGFLLALTVLGAAMSDIIAQHRRVAEQDPLTGLLNRRGFDAALAGAPEVMGATGAVIVGDIDRFKDVNDGFGHAAGDQVILTLADILRRHLPDSAVIARFGGEEFVAVLRGLDAAAAARLADAVRQNFANEDWRTKGISSQITASFGVAAVTGLDRSVSDAVRRADACLYRAKSAGRNRVVAEGEPNPDPGPKLRVVGSA